MPPHRASEETCWTNREGDGAYLQRSRGSSQVQRPLRDMNVTVPASDERRIEVLLGRTGEAQPNAAATDRAVLTQARVDKETKYPEILTSGRCHLMVVAIETGGRWSDEAADLVWQLAQAKSRPG